MADDLTSERRIAGNRVKAFRIGRGWKQADLAERLKVSVGTINRWEKGKTGIEAGNLQKLADTLAVSPRILTGEEDPFKKEKRSRTTEEEPDVDAVVQIWMAETNNTATQVMDSLRAAAEFVTHAVEAMERFRDRTRALEADLKERLGDRVDVPELAMLHGLLDKTTRFAEDRLSDRSLDISRQNLSSENRSSENVSSEQHDKPADS